MALLIQNARHVIVSAVEVLDSADVRVEGNKIAEVGHRLPAMSEDTVIDATGKIVFPGFVNTHTHLYQNLLKGRGDSLGLKEWCETVTFPLSNVIHCYRREHGDNSIGYAFGLLGAVEMLRSGITSFVDMDTISDPLLTAWQELGIRGRGAIQTVNRWVPESLIMPDEKRLLDIEALIGKWHGKGLQEIYIAPSTIFTCTTEFMRELQMLAHIHNVRMQIHVSETRWEIEQSLEEYGLTPLEYLNSIGFLDDPVIAVHCVHLTEKEMEICRDKDVTVSYNPKSNGKLGNGIAPITELRDLGVSLCLATDGAASNDLLDMFEDMRFGAMLQKIRHRDPGIFGEKDIFRIATEGGAKALGLDAGRIETGKLADLVLMDVSIPEMSPLHDPVSALVYCGKSCDVETVIIDGKIVMENRQILVPDIERKIEEALDLGRRRLCEMQGPIGAKF